MVSYKLLIKPSAAKELEAIATKDRRKVITKIEAIAGEPLTPRLREALGTRHYRVRQGGEGLVNRTV